MLPRIRILARWRAGAPPSRSLAFPTARFQSSQSTAQGSRIDRITSKLPRRLQKYTNGLRNAPVSHVVSFLILHELTAVVPLFVLFGFFHYTNYVPLGYMTEHFGNYVDSSVAKFERYFSRKGWAGFEKQTEGANSIPGAGSEDPEARTEEAVQRWQSGDQKYKILVEVALAYALTKVLLPVRIIGSVWATPWFAGVMVRLRSKVMGK
ncbi:unnamed protein product [Clonostachys solani]|uniref:Uncharacterized protein n=1 Tax=Clonostachys solani TaxID=160281 RepID=A0A9P0ETG3_9HYPO|nr:unnamed protein product [Clonostachys solani]